MASRKVTWDTCKSNLMIPGCDWVWLTSFWKAVCDISRKKVVPEIRVTSKYVQVALNVSILVALTHKQNPFLSADWQIVMCKDWLLQIASRRYEKSALPRGFTRVAQSHGITAAAVSLDSLKSCLKGQSRVFLCDSSIYSWNLGSHVHGRYWVSSQTNNESHATQGYKSQRDTLETADDVVTF